MEPDEAGVTELESLEAALEVPGARHLLQPWEDERVCGAALVIQQVYAVLIVATDGPQVASEDPKDRFSVHLDPEEQFLPEPGARDVLPCLGGDPEPDPRGRGSSVHHGGGGADIGTSVNGAKGGEVLVYGNKKNNIW